MKDIPKVKKINNSQLGTSRLILLGVKYPKGEIEPERILKGEVS